MIEEPKPSRGSYVTWLEGKGETKPPTVRRQLEQIIDDKITFCKDFSSFISALENAGVEVKHGKNLALKLPGAKRFVRLKSLGDEYSESAVKARIAGQKNIAKQQKKPNLLIDIQSKMQQANSLGYERWARKFNLKEMAKTVMYLQERGLLDYEVLQKTCAEASEKYNSVSAKTKANSERMKEITQLEKHIGAYRKTKDIYAEYRKLPAKKQTAFYEQHRSQIVQCEAAKRYFNELGMKKLPSVKMLKQEYAVLQAENKKLYSKQKQDRAKMLELLTVKSNVERILGLPDIEQQRQSSSKLDVKSSSSRR